MSKNSGIAVRHNLRKYAYDHSIDRFTRFSTEVLTVRQQPDGRCARALGGAVALPAAVPATPAVAAVSMAAMMMLSWRSWRRHRWSPEALLADALLADVSAEACAGTSGS